MSTLLGKSITKASYGKDIFIDLDKRHSLDRESNMVLVGSEGSGKTKAVKNILNQIVTDEKTNIIVITSKASEYRNISNLTVESAEEMNDSYELRYRINHLINVNYLDGLRTVVVIDDNYLFYKKELVRFVEDVSLLSKVHNCVLISTWNRVSHIPKYIIKTTDVFQVFRLYKDDLINLNFKGFTLDKANKTLKFKRGQRILNIDERMILIESEQ